MNVFVQAPGEKPGVWKASLNLLLVSALLVGVFWSSLQVLGVSLDFSFVVQYRVRIASGFGMTVALSLVGFALSLALGVLSALGENSRLLFLRYLCEAYVKLIRGTPLIMQIYLFFYILGTAWGIDNRFWAGCLILSLFEGAYIAEIVRGSLLSVDAAQLEAARAVGFTRAQTARYVLLPQMVARTLPALTGQFASIIKDSSLLSVIAVVELTQTIREISATNFRLFESYFFLGLLYLCLTLPISMLSRRLERRFRYEA